MKKNISILGSTGSVGKNALEVIDRFPQFSAVALSVKENIDLLEEQIVRFRPKIVAVYDEGKAKVLRGRNLGVKVVFGMEGMVEVATYGDADFVIAAMSGISGLVPVLEAIKSKKGIGLANKEVLVAGGEYVMGLAKREGVDIIPVDSEHSAIFQCLKGHKRDEVRRLILTASGGPFRDYSSEALEKVGVQDALCHPTYSMGRKISIDSSTLMNKGLEVIEAFWLFGVDYRKIDVVIHKESLVHSFVEFFDGSMLAQISRPDMRLPIQYALGYPGRLENSSEPFDFEKFSNFSFTRPDFDRFRSLFLAYEALREGGSMACYLNGANEVLVERFLNGEISWKDISKKLEKLISFHRKQDMLSLEAILEVDRMARKEALSA